MIHPSYSELIEAINTNNEDDDESMVLNSRYSLILATSKRARQLIGGAKPLADNVKGRNLFLSQLTSYITERLRSFQVNMRKRI